MATTNLSDLGGQLGRQLAGWRRDAERDQFIGPQGQRIDAYVLQQQGIQQLAMGNYPATGYTAATGDTYTIKYKQERYFAKAMADPGAAPTRKKTETNLQWLDRRVAEMRVKL